MLQPPLLHLALTPAHQDLVDNEKKKSYFQSFKFNIEMVDLPPGDGTEGFGIVGVLVVARVVGNSNTVGIMIIPS